MIFLVMPKVSVKVSVAGVTLEASGDAAAVDAQVEKFLERLAQRGPSLRDVRTVYDAITLVLYRAGERHLTRGDIETALRAEGVTVKNVAQALADTKRHKKYITQAKKRGTWKLTSRGHEKAEELLRPIGRVADV